jgi:mRNA deadenylase 3'-5' endonuclease subunit Ccr4
MEKKFSSTIINDKYKIEKLLRRLKKFEVDIFFLQDVD